MQEDEEGPSQAPQLARSPLREESLEQVWGGTAAAAGSALVLVAAAGPSAADLTVDSLGQPPKTSSWGRGQGWGGAELLWDCAAWGRIFQGPPVSLLLPPQARRFLELGHDAGCLGPSPPGSHTPVSTGGGGGEQHGSSEPLSSKISCKLLSGQLWEAVLFSARDQSLFPAAIGVGGQKQVGGLPLG